jgi:PAS domain S-box-containing protein
VPIVGAGGRAVGVLCAVDHAPRAWSAEDVELLGAVAAAAAGELELHAERAARLAAERAQGEGEASLRALLGTLRALAVVTDAQGTVTFANEPFLSLTGWSRDEVVGRDWFERFTTGGDAARQQFLGLVAAGEMPAHFTSELVTIVGVARVGHDIVERRALDVRLASLNEHDELTGLLNRRGFRRMVGHIMKSAPRAGRRDAIL